MTGVTGHTGVSILNLDLSGSAVNGITVSGGGINSISEVNVSRIEGSPGGYGLQLASSNNNTIQNITATNRTNAVILTSGSAGNTIQTSNLSGNTTAIQSAQAGQGNSYLNNNLSGATLWAIVVYNDDLVQISGNDYTLTTNAIYLNGVDSVTIDGENLAWTGSGQVGIGLQLDGSSSNNTIQNLSVNKRTYGILLDSGTANQISCGSFTNNSFGVLGQGTSTGVSVNQSIIQGNSVGVQSTALLIAENNYWGSADGPSPIPGSGDSFSGNVDAVPFGSSAQDVHSACGRAGNITALDFETAPGPDGTLGTLDDVTLTENDLIDDEFASLGVSFSLVGSVSFTGGAAPIIAAEGTPLAAFASSIDADAPTSSPVNSITPGASSAGSCPCLKALQVDFATPVSSVSIFVLDFDSIARQVLYIIAIDASDNEINRGTITSLGFPGGDGAIQELSVSAPGIYSVQIDSDTINDNGIGFDDLSFLY